MSSTTTSTTSTSNAETNQPNGTSAVKGASALDFPALQSATEAARLRAQHALIVSAVGGLVLAPLDLSQPHLRILDCGAADGFYLHELRRSLPPAAAATAKLVGVDVAEYPAFRPSSSDENADGVGGIGALELHTQNVLAPFPASWRNSFDLVQLRATLSNLAGREQAVAALRNVIPLLKPGTGWLQLIDGGVESRTAGEENNKPSRRLLGVLATSAQSMGRDLSVGKDLAGLLRDAEEEGVVKMDNVESRTVTTVFGRGAGEPALEQAGVIEVCSLYRIVKACMWRMEDMAEGAMVKSIWDKSGVTRDEFENLEDALVDEARTEGVPWEWYTVVARRVA